MNDIYAKLSYALVPIPEGTLSQGLVLLEKGNDNYGFAYCPPEGLYFQVIRNLPSFIDDIKRGKVSVVEVRESSGISLVDRLIEVTKASNGRPSMEVSEILNMFQSSQVAVN